MIPEKIIHEELLRISPTLAATGKQNVYSIPTKYFDDLSDRIIAKIKLGADPVYYFPKEILYSVPENYFETLAENISRKIKTSKQVNCVFDELESVAPFLNTISKEPVYNIPTGYFDTIKPKQVQKNRRAKVVISSFAKLYKYAAAAAITGILAVGIFLFSNKENKALQANNNKPKIEVNNLSEDDISEFLSNGAGETKMPANVSGSVYSPDVQTAVKEISDEEINQFLQETDAHEGI